jgi:hypothetical protein
VSARRMMAAFIVSWGVCVTLFLADYNLAQLRRQGGELFPVRIDQVSALFEGAAAGLVLWALALWLFHWPLLVRVQQLLRGRGVSVMLPLVSAGVGLLEAGVVVTTFWQRSFGLTSTLWAWNIYLIFITANLTFGLGFLWAHGLLGARNLFSRP